MVGAPGETFENYLETVELNRQARPDSMQMTTYYPFPGSDLHDYAVAQGFFAGAAYTDSFVSYPLLKMPQFPRWQIDYAARTFDLRVHAAVGSGVMVRLALLKHLVGALVRSVRRNLREMRAFI